MIHSLSGGVLKDNTPVDFCKVRIIESNQIAWYLCTNFPQLKISDRVQVPFGATNDLKEAEVVRIDKSISPQITPIPLKRAKSIYSIL